MNAAMNATSVAILLLGDSTIVSMRWFGDHPQVDLWQVYGRFPTCEVKYDKKKPDSHHIKKGKKTRDIESMYPLVIFHSYVSLPAAICTADFVMIRFAGFADFSALENTTISISI